MTKRITPEMRAMAWGKREQAAFVKNLRELITNGQHLNAMFESFPDAAFPITPEFREAIGLTEEIVCKLSNELRKRVS